MIYTIAIAVLSVTAAMFAMLYFQNRKAAQKYETKAEQLSKEASELEVELARKGAETAQSPVLLTPEVLLKFFTEERGIQAEYDPQAQWMTLQFNDSRLNINCSRLPQQLILRKGYGLEGVDMNLDAMRESSRKVIDDLVLVKMNIEPKEYFDYYIICMDRTLDTFRINFDFYISILNDADRQFRENYDALVGEKGEGAAPGYEEMAGKKGNETGQSKILS